MAIKGAFGAGFARGFADDFVGRIDARTEKQDKYMDLMIENARAKAPKYAAYKAQQTQLDSLGKQLQTDFNLTKAEVEFLKGKGALQDFHKTVYEQRNAAEAVNQTYNFDKNLFFAAMNLEDRTLPMNTADRLAVAGKAYNESVSGSKNPKSETTRVNSAKNALAKLLAFNPRLSAEQAVRAMEVAGYSADELMDWDPNAPRQDLYSDIALPTTAIPVVEFTAGENKTVINESGTKLRRLIGIEDVNGNPLNYATGDVLAANAPKNKKTLELAALTEEGANTFAQINKRLAYQGLGNPQQLNVLSNRYSALSYFRSKIDTEQELRFLIDAEKKGLVTEFLLNNPMPTDEQLNDFFSQDAENAEADLPKNGDKKGKTAKAVTPVNAQTEAAVNANQQAAITGMPNGNAVARMLAEQGVTSESLTDDDMGLPDGPVNFGLTDDDMGLPDSPVVDTLAPAISSGAAASEWLSSVNPIPSTEDLNTGLVTANYKVASATNAGLATAIDFLTGFVGGTQETTISRNLKKLSRTQAERAAKVAALGFTEYFSSDLPPQEVIDEVKDNYVKLFTSTSDTPAYKELQQLIQDRIEYADRKRAETPDVVQDNTDLEAAMVATDDQNKRIRDNDRQFLADEKNFPQPLENLESASPSQITQALASLPDMPDKIQAALFDTQGKINTYIASLFEETLEERIMQNEGQQNRVVALQALKDKIADMREEAEETEVEPLVTRRKKLKKPKGMTSSDKARLKRAQKADKLSGDTSLLEMLVNKYGIALVQKEMGL